MDPYDKLNEMYINAFSPSEWADKFIQELTAKTDNYYEFSFSSTQEQQVNDLYKQFKES